MKGQGLPISVAAGALIVPLTAVLAVVLVAPGQPSPDEALASETAAVAAPEIQATAASTAPDETLGADLAASCGPAGRELAAAESDGSATEVQRAVLEALRPICAAVGMPLPDSGPPVATTAPPVPEPVTVEVPAAPDEDGEWEAEYEDGEWEVDD